MPFLFGVDLKAGDDSAVFFPILSTETVGSPAPAGKPAAPADVVAFDYGRLQSELGSADCGDVAAGTGTQHEHVAFDIYGARKRSGLRRRRWAKPSP